MKFLTAAVKGHQPVADPPACPRCRHAMVCRQNSKTGQWFFGCSQFPVCTGTRSGNEYDPPDDDCYYGI